MKRYFIAYDRYSGELTPELSKKQIFDKKKKLRSATRKRNRGLQPKKVPYHCMRPSEQF